MTGLQLRLLVLLRVIRALGLCSTAIYFEHDEPRGCPGDLRDICDSVVSGGRTRPYATFSVAERVGHRVDFAVNGCLGRIGRRYPFSVSFDAVGAQERIAAEAERVGADVVVLPTFLSHYAPRLLAQGCAVIGEATDVLEIQARNFLRIYGARRPLRAPGLLANYVAIRTLERKALPLCAEIWANSTPQARELQRVAPETNIVVVGNVLDEARILAAPLSDAHVVGFIGNYSYAPNLDAATYLVEKVVPRLRARGSDARLALAGGGLPSGLEQRWSAIDGVDVLGRVPDSGAFMRSCGALAFPLFFESGPPLKVVEALAYGRPVVVSPQIAAALDLRDGEHALVARTPSETADRIGRVLEDRPLAQHLVARGRATFERRFSLGSAISEARRRSFLSDGREETHGQPRAMKGPG